jgi:WD40 repeat protein
MDRIIRLWNPYLSARPVARLRGHNAPVFLVKIAVEDNRLFSISADKTVLISLWFRLFFVNVFFLLVNHKQVQF